MEVMLVLSIQYILHITAWQHNLRLKYTIIYYFQSTFTLIFISNNHTNNVHFTNNLEKHTSTVISSCPLQFYETNQPYNGIKTIKIT